MNDPERRQLAVFCFFEEVPDPRVERTRRHSLMDVLVIALLTMMCVGEGWEDMEEFGLAKQDWLKTFHSGHNVATATEAVTAIAIDVASATDSHGNVARWGPGAAVSEQKRGRVYDVLPVVKVQ